MQSGLYLTCSRDYPILLSDFLCFIIRNRRLAYIVCFGFLQCGIPHRTCRFYWLLAGAVGKRQGISIPYPSPTPLLTPWGIRCGGALLLPRVWGNIGIWIQVQVAYPQFRIWFCYLCSGYGRSRFSRGVGRVSFVFHYWGDRLFVSAATWGFCQNLS